MYLGASCEVWITYTQTHTWIGSSMHGGDVDVKDKAQLNTQQLHIDKHRV